MQTRQIGPKLELHWEPWMHRGKRRTKPLPTTCKGQDELCELVSRFSTNSIHRIPNICRASTHATRLGVSSFGSSGRQLNHLPEDSCDNSSIHRTLQRWTRLGVFDRMWSLLVMSSEELVGVDWLLQSIDGSMAKVRSRCHSFSNHAKSAGQRKQDKSVSIFSQCR